MTGKSQGGGGGIYVNERWCDSSVKVRSQRCTADVELSSVSPRPRYLPRELGQLFLTVVYLTTTVNAARAASGITDTVHALQMISPDAPNFILGDFNSCNLRPNLPTFKQHVTCPTRLSETFDLRYDNIPDA